MYNSICTVMYIVVHVQWCIQWYIYSDVYSGYETMMCGDLYSMMICWCILHYDVHSMMMMYAMILSYALWWTLHDDDAYLYMMIWWRYTLDDEVCHDDVDTTKWGMM